jgi:cytoskeletal protein CcmA (bactofilin family)
MTHVSLSRLRARTSKFIAGLAVGALAFASMAPLAAAAGSWSPTLLVNTESFEQIDSGDGSTNIELRFGSSSITLKYLTNGKFQFSAGLSVLGTLSGSALNVDRNATIGGSLTVTGAILTNSSVTANSVLSNTTVTAKTSLSGTTLRVSNGADVHGPLAVTGAIRTDSNITINDDADSNNAVLTFGNTSGNQTITYLNTLQKFQFSKPISVLGTISGSSLNVDRNATVGGTLTVSGAVLANTSLTAKTTLSGSILRVSNNAAVHGAFAASGAVRTDSNLTINDDADTNDAVLTFGNNTANQSITYSNASQRFSFSKDVRILGSISGSTLNVDGNITWRGKTYVGPATQGAGALTNDGAGNLSWTPSTVGNGSGTLISMHPEYPGAIYFSSGSVFVGQLSLSGGTSGLENTFRWSSTKAALNDYWISVRVRLPDNFSSWDPTKPIELRYKTGVASNASNYVSVRIKDTAGVERPLTGGEALASTTFATASIKGPEAGGTWTPKGYITVYVKLAANSTANAYAAAGFLNLNFETTTP